MDLPVVIGNAGTPLMYAVPLHLLLGNVVLALIEAGVVWRIFRAWPAGLYAKLLAANFASALVGVGLAVGLATIDRHWPVTVRWAGWFIAAGWLAAIGLTLLVEYPFFRWAVRRAGDERAGPRAGADEPAGDRAGQPAVLAGENEPAPAAEGTRRLISRRSWRVTLLAHAVSYPLLLAFYLAASPMSAVTGFDVVGGQASLVPDDGWVYFVSQEAAIERVRLATGDRERVEFSAWPIEETGLVLLPRRERGGGLAAYAFQDGTDAYVEIAETQRTPRRLGWPDDETALHGAPIEKLFKVRSIWGLGMGRGTEFGRVQGEGSDDDSTVFAGFWAAEGLRVRDPATRFALETPFLSWRCRSATRLPSGVVVFQAERQILAMNPQTRRVQLLAIGRSPVVVLDGVEGGDGAEGAEEERAPETPVGTAGRREAGER